MTGSGRRRGRPGVARDDRGATAAEYAIIASLIAVVVAVAVATFGQAVLGLFNLVPPHLFG